MINEQKKCKICGNIIPFNKKEGSKRRENRKFCSTECSRISFKELAKQEKSEEHKRKISESNKGIERSYATKNLGNYIVKKGEKRKAPIHEDTNEKIRQALTGVPLTEERKKNISDATQGRIPWNKGLKGFRAKELSNFWKGGITPLNGQIRATFEYRMWRKAVFERDHFSCIQCGDDKGGNLEADHFPKSFAEILFDNDIRSIEDAINCSELWDIENGRTLCTNCHKATESYAKNLFQLMEIKEAKS